EWVGVAAVSAGAGVVRLAAAPLRGSAAGAWYFVRACWLGLGPSVGSWSLLVRWSSVPGSCFVPGPWSSVRPLVLGPFRVLGPRSVRWFLVRSGSLVLDRSLVPSPSPQSPVPRPQSPAPSTWPDPGPPSVAGPHPGPSFEPGTR